MKTLIKITICLIVVLALSSIGGYFLLSKQNNIVHSFLKSNNIKINDNLSFKFESYDFKQNLLIGTWKINSPSIVIKNPNNEIKPEQGNSITITKNLFSNTVSISLPEQYSFFENKKKTSTLKNKSQTIDLDFNLNLLKVIEIKNFKDLELNLSSIKHNLKDAMIFDENDPEVNKLKIDTFTTKISKISSEDKNNSKYELINHLTAIPTFTFNNKSNNKTVKLNLNTILTLENKPENLYLFDYFTKDEVSVILDYKDFNLSIDKGKVYLTKPGSTKLKFENKTLELLETNAKISIKDFNRSSDEIKNMYDTYSQDPYFIASNLVKQPKTADDLVISKWITDYIDKNYPKSDLESNINWDVKIKPKNNNFIGNIELSIKDKISLVLNFNTENNNQNYNGEININNSNSIDEVFNYVDNLISDMNRDNPLGMSIDINHELLPSIKSLLSEISSNSKDNDNSYTIKFEGKNNKFTISNKQPEYVLNKVIEMQRFVKISENQNPKLSILDIANNGDSVFEYYQGVIEYFKNAEKSIKWLNKSAKQGYTPAMTLLGFKYLYNKDRAEQDKALSWLEKASESNDKYAMQALGVMYATGIGASKNKTKSETLFKKLNKNNKYAKSNLTSLDRNIPIFLFDSPFDKFVVLNKDVISTNVVKYMTSTLSAIVLKNNLDSIESFKNVNGRHFTANGIKSLERMYLKPIYTNLIINDINSYAATLRYYSRVKSNISSDDNYTMIITYPISVKFKDSNKATRYEMDVKLKLVPTNEEENNFLVTDINIFKMK